MDPWSSLLYNTSSPMSQCIGIGSQTPAPSREVQNAKWISNIVNCMCATESTRVCGNCKWREHGHLHLPVYSPISRHIWDTFRWWEEQETRQKEEVKPTNVKLFFKIISLRVMEGERGEAFITASSAPVIPHVHVGPLSRIYLDAGSYRVWSVHAEC